MLTVEKLKKMQPWEIFASWEWVDDWKVFNIWWEWCRIKWVAVRWKGYHDRAIYYHIINPKSAEKAKDQNDLLLYLYHSDWWDDHIASNWDKLTRESTIKAIVPCDDKAFDLYRY
jgi:hypothetical protein